MPIDNSAENIVNTTVKEHIQIHYFYAMYFLEKSKLTHLELDHFLAYANANALNYLLKTNIFLIDEDTFKAILDKTSVIVKQNASAYNKALWQNPEYRKSVIAARIKARTPENEAQRLKSLRYTYASGKANTESIGRYSRERWKNLEYKKKVIAARKKYNEEHPESRINAGKKISESLRSNPGKLKERNKKTGAAIKAAYAKLSLDEKKKRAEKLKEHLPHYEYFLMDKNDNIVQKFKNIDAVLSYLHQIGRLNTYGKEIKKDALQEAIRRYFQN